MSAAAGPAAVAGVGLSLASGIMGGEGQKAADQYQSAELSEQSQMGQAAASEENANMTQRLNQALGNIDAVRAASGDSMAAPTAQALRGVTTTNSNQQRVIQVGNILQQSAVDQAGANYMQSAGSFALEQGILGGVAGAAGMTAGTNWSKLGL